MKWKSLMRRLWINRKTIARKAMAMVGIMYTIWGFVSLFINNANMVDGSVGGGCRLLIGIVALLGSFVFSAVCTSWWCLCSKSTRLISSNSGAHVYVKYGDFLAFDVVGEKPISRVNKVVAVNRCFDTIVDDNIISRQSLHGQVMQSLYDKGMYDSSSLADDIQRQLERVKAEHCFAPEKVDGNRERYECGAVAEIKVSDALTYFFLGLCTLDEANKPTTEKEEFVVAINRMIEYANARSQGYPVVLPIIGTGLARTNIHPADALQYIVSAFKINKEIINCDYYIIVSEKMKDSVPIKDI